MLSIHARRAVLGALLLAAVAGCAADAPTRPERSSEAVAVEVTATVAPDGVAGLAYAVRFATSEGGRVPLRATPVGTIDTVSIDATPVSTTTSGASTADVFVASPAATVSGRLTGAVERYGDIAVVTVPIWSVTADAERYDPVVAVHGVVHVPGPVIDGTVHWHGSASGSASIAGTDVVFDGTVHPYFASDLVFAVPADAFAQTAVVSPDQRRAYYDDRQGVLDRGDRRLRDDLADDGEQQDLYAGIYWGAVAAEVAIPLLVALGLLWRSAHVRRTATRGVPATLVDPPGDDPPALVALLHAEGRDIGAGAVAGTILWLAHRKEVGIEAGAQGRYRLSVGAARGVDPLTTALRQAAHGGFVEGPPLPLAANGTWWKAMRRNTVDAARSRRLIRRRYPSSVFVVFTILLALTTAPLWARSAVEAAAGFAVAGLLCMLPFVGGYVLTAAGHRLRAQWEAFGRYAADNSEIDDADAAGVIIWGPYLAYGAALGLAPHATAQLAPAEDAK